MHRTRSTPIWLVAGAVGLLLLAIGVRLSREFKPLPPNPAPPPAGPLEAYFVWQPGNANLDPIILERERRVFDEMVGILRANPDVFDAWMTLGATKKTIGDLTGAAAVWEQVGVIRPNNSISFNNLGDLYANFLPDYPKAEAAYRTAIKNSAGEEKNYLFTLSLFELYRYRFMDPARALSTLAEGIAANPGNVPLTLQVARYAGEIGKREQALAHYRAAIKLLPQDGELAAEYRQFRDQR